MNLVRSLWILIAISSLLFAGCFGGGWGGGFSMPPTLVETAEATMQPVTDHFETVGTLEADEAVTLVAEIPGTIVRIPFDEGGRVERGELIAQIDDSEQRAALDRALAVRDQARVNHERVKTIVDQGAGSKQNLDDADATLKVAEADAALSQARYDKTRITAPFGGLVGARRVSAGTFVSPGTPITDLARVQELRVNFSIPERYLTSLKRGSEVQVTNPAFPGLELEGKIEVVEPLVDPGTRSVKVVARVQNKDGKFRPGMSANVAAVLNQRPSALTITSEAVVVDQNQPIVYVIKPDCTVTRTVLKLGSRTSNAVEVVSGLEAGQLVVKAGHQKIFDGAKVIPVSSIDSAAAAAAAQAAGGQTQ